MTLTVQLAPFADEEGGGAARTQTMTMQVETDTSVTLGSPSITTTGGAGVRGRCAVGCTKALSASVTLALQADIRTVQTATACVTISFTCSSRCDV